MSVFATPAPKAAGRPLVRAKTDRERDAERKREQRSLFRDVAVTWPENLRRRRRLEKDDAAWLRWYFHKTFTYEFTQQQREMIEAISTAIRHGGDQALAASRGEGKTKISEGCIIKAVLTGVISFAVFCAATGGKATDSLQAIKHELETNGRLLADYPEVCVPVRALENTPSRAHYQTVSGQRMDNRKWYAAESSRFTWCGDEIILPNVPGAPAAGAIIATRGLDAEIRGLNKLGKRVGMVLIDDPDTEQTVHNPEQAVKLEARIDRGIAGLGGQKRGVARVLITTLQRRECVSAKFTDPKQKPSWMGRRFRFLIHPPERIDLWQEYIALRDQDMRSGDPLSRRSHAFYLERREQMDAGAKCSNPNRFNDEVLPDGSLKEVSALQRYFNEVQRIGQEAVSTEYDNDPPEESGPQESGITAWRIQKQVSGYPRKIIPPGCSILTQGVDCRKVAMHWVVRAWHVDEQDCLITGYTIDYGIQDVWGTTVGSDEGVDAALIRALTARKAAMDDAHYQTQEGEIRGIDLTLVDAGWRTEAIYEACRQLGLGFRPSMGFGKSNGCVKTNFTSPTKSSPEKKVGDRWFLSKQAKGQWLVCMDADFWKSFEHDRWMTDPNRNGSLQLWGEPGAGDRLSDDQKKHLTYSKHLTAETEVEDVAKGVLKRFWKSKSDNNHYFDASYMSDVAASMKGVRLVRNPRPAATIEAGEWFKS